MKGCGRDGEKDDKGMGRLELAVKFVAVKELRVK